MFFCNLTRTRFSNCAGVLNYNYIVKKNLVGFVT